MNSLENSQKDLAEIESFLSQATRPNTKRVLGEQKILLSNLVKKELELAESTKSKDDNKETTTTISYTTISKYAFENTEKFAKLYFTSDLANLKTHDKDKITSTFQETGFTVCILEWKGKNLRFVSNNLSSNIVPADSYVKATASGLIVYLKKEKSETWDGLEKKKSPMGMGGNSDSPSTDKDDPNAGMMNMMKEMYQNGDDNTKRMIAESWSKAQDGKNPGGMGGGMPGMGGMGGGMPGMGGMGGMPGMEGMGGMPNMGGKEGGMPDMSKMGDMAKMMEQMKGMGLGGEGGEGGMPDMSKMGDMAKMMEQMKGMKK